MSDLTSSTIASLSKTAATTNISATTGGTSALQVDSSEWLTLLTTELKYQDPNAPSDPMQFVAQFASISQLSLQNENNSTLKSLLSQMSAGALAQATTMIGKTVSAAGDSYTVPASGSAPTANYGFTVSDPSLSNVHLQVMNSQGSVISQSAITGTAGTIAFKGTDASGNALPAGSYTLGLVGTNSSGTTVAAGALNTSGTVKQVLQGTGGALQLQLDNGSVVEASSVTGLGSS